MRHVVKRPPKYVTIKRIDTFTDMKIQIYNQLLRTSTENDTSDTFPNADKFKYRYYKTTIRRKAAGKIQK